MISRRLVCAVALFIFLFGSECTIWSVASVHAQPSELPTSSLDQEKTEELTTLEVLSEYVTIVGGAVAAAIAILGAPLVLLNYRKTRAEITKMELEAEKLKSELGAGQSAWAHDDMENGFSIKITGSDNSVSVQVDPRLSLPLIVLIDAFIAYFYYRIVLFGLGALPFRLPEFISTPIYAVIFIIIFIPVFRSASRVKKDIGNIMVISTNVQENK